MKKVLYAMVILLTGVLVIFLLEVEKPKETEYKQPIDVVEVVEETVEEVLIETGSCVFDENIVFELEYVDEGEVMPYALLKPSVVDEKIQMPLIVWLHGAGEINASQERFLKALPTEGILNWELLNFNAYVICPQLKNNYNTKVWCSDEGKSNLKQLLDNFIETHNIDQEKIIVAGTSLGGQGTIYMAVMMDEYFDKAAIFSGYSCSTSFSDIEYPVIGYVGTLAKAEDSTSIAFMSNLFEEQLGKQYLHVINASHGELPKVVFGLDNDGNGKSDIIEWMLFETNE